jgi:hypothetical protein
MATDKKHIAVYLAPEIEQALIAFCQEKGLMSKKGTMFSAGVNAALAQFFGIADTRTSNTPVEIGNISSGTDSIPQEAGSILNSSNILASAGSIPDKSVGNIPNKSVGNIPNKLVGNILPDSGNIPSESLVMEGLPGKF